MKRLTKSRKKYIVFFVIFKAQILRNNRANKFYKNRVTKNLRSKITKENKKISILSVNFKDESSLF